MQDHENVSFSLIYAVRDGNLNKARALINSYGLSYSQDWAEGYYLLWLAVKNKHTEIAKLLLANGSKVNRNRRIRPSNTPLHFAAMNGDLEIFKMILDKGADINAKNDCGKTALFSSIENNKIEFIQLLLDYRADVNVKDNDGLSPLHIAVEVGSQEVTSLLLSRGANHNSKAENNITPLHIASRKGCALIVKELLSHGACTHFLTLKEGYAPIHFASELGNEEIMKLLLNSGADINARTKSNATPLHNATKNGHEIIVKLLLQKGAKIDNQDNKGKTILYLAVEKQYLTIVEDILKYCPDINSQCNRNALKTAILGYGEKHKKTIAVLLEYGFTVNPFEAKNPKLLRAAVEKGYYKIVDDLLKYGADVNMLHNSIFKDRFTPLHSAAKYKQQEIAKLLISYNANVNAEDQVGKTPIFYAIKRADVNITKLLLSNKANIKDYSYLLTMAVQKEYIAIVEVLLQYDIDVNASDEYGRTALHFTAFSVSKSDGSIQIQNKNFGNDRIKGEIAKLLLKKGANVNAQSVYGETTLYFSIQKQYVTVIDILLEYNANISSLLKTGVTPLYYSVQIGNKEISTMLLNKGADVNTNEIHGFTPLHVAVNEGHEEIVKILLEYGAKVDAKTRSDTTPLHLGAEKGNQKIVEILLKGGATIEYKDAFGMTPLHIACKQGSIEMVKTLLKCGSDIHSRDKYGMGALHIASMNGHAEVVTTLLKYGSGINSIDKCGRTPLHMASEAGHLEIVETLLKSGADINIASTNNGTPLSLSRSYEITKVLKCQLIKMKIANLYVSEQNLRSLRKQIQLLDIYENFQSECEKEVANIKKEEFSNTNISFYDILTKDANLLVKYVRNANVVQILKSDAYETKFPLYTSIIKNNFRKAMKRKELLEQVSNTTFHFLFKNLPELPDHCIEKILTYLSDENLKTLMDDCQPKTVPEVQ